MSPELQRLADRAALPIAVAHDGTAFGIATHDRIWFPPTVWGANWIYRTLVAELSDPAKDSSPAATCGGCSVLSSPRGEL